MKWHHVAENWPAFYEAITDRWPDAEEEALEEVDGDQRAFILYVAELTGQGVQFQTLNIAQPDLESVFLTLTGRSLRD